MVETLEKLLYVNSTIGTRVSINKICRDLSLPWVVYEYEDVFPDKLSGLPLHRDVDFCIELHPGMSPISMTPHRIATVELQELKVQLQEWLNKGFIRSSTSP